MLVKGVAKMSDKTSEVTEIDIRTAHRANEKFGGSASGRSALSIGDTKYSLGTQMLDMVEENILLEDKNKTLEARATTDQLTNLSRKEELEKYLAENLVPGEPVTLLFFDIDHFKDVNDTYGHLIGDKVLQVLGERLNTVFPNSAGNFLCRYGGEEFVVVMKGLSNEEVGVRRAEQFRKLMEENPVVITTGEVNSKLVLEKTVSAGVAVKAPDETFEQWINEADRALYFAKDTGRNKVIPISTVPSDFKK